MMLHSLLHCFVKWCFKVWSVTHASSLLCNHVKSMWKPASFSFLFPLFFTLAMCIKGLLHLQHAHLSCSVTSCLAISVRVRLTPHAPITVFPHKNCCYFADTFTHLSHMVRGPVMLLFNPYLLHFHLMCYNAYAFAISMQVNVNRKGSLLWF